mgnify:CR=1 FL=1
MERELDQMKMHLRTSQSEVCLSVSLSLSLAFVETVIDMTQ